MVERFSYVATSRDLGFDDDTLIDNLATFVQRVFFANRRRVNERYLAPAGDDRDLAVNDAHLYSPAGAAHDGALCLNAKPDVSVRR